MSKTPEELLGKPTCPMEFCISVLEGRSSTIEKKEAMSSIGRKRDPENKPILFQYAAHSNPEVAMQAIRGLLTFKKDSDVVSFLHKLVEHPNDMIKDIAHTELANGTIAKRGSHADSPDYLKNAVVEGDVLEILDNVPEDSIHLTFTSPPYYNARDYSIYANYAEYLSFLENVFTKIYRITKEGRFFVLNTSPVIVPRAGRKYASRRYAVPFDIHAKLMQIGWEFVDDIIWEKPEKSAKNRISNFNVNRKPLTYKPNSCTEYVMVYRKKSHRLIDWNLKQYDDVTLSKSLVDDDFDRSNVWNIAPVSSKVHSAVFPIELCRKVIKLYSFKNDLIFDPFAGSGTVAMAAFELGRDFFLTEVCKDYVDTIEERLKHNLFTRNRYTRLDLEEFKDGCNRAQHL